MTPLISLCVVATTLTTEMAPPAKYGVVQGTPPPATVAAPRLRLDEHLTLPDDRSASPNGDGSAPPADAAALEEKKRADEKPEQK